jgi:DNA-binding NarL/FixJ family response regulator
VSGLLARVSGASTLEALAVMVVEPEEISRWAFHLLLTQQTWVERCYEVSSEAEAIALCAERSVHVALVSADLDGSSIACCQRLRKAAPTVRLLIVETRDETSGAAARAAGAVGIVSRRWPSEMLASAIHHAGKGGEVFPRLRVDTDVSARERDVMLLLAKGATNREIAHDLCLSPHTVKAYTVRLYRKLGARNRAEAVLNAHRRGFLN